MLQADSSIDSNPTQQAVKRRYQYLLGTQALMIVLVMIVFEFVNEQPHINLMQVMLPGMGLFGVLLSYQMWRMITEFTENPWVKYGTFACIFNRFAMVLFIISPIGQSLPIEQQSQINAVSMLFSLIGMVVMLLFMINDIFNHHHEITYRLWGAGCIYIMIGALFGNVFYLIEILLPGSMGVPEAGLLQKTLHSVTHSYYIVSGIDSKYEQVSSLVRNVSVVESIFINLYLVLLVGRMLSK